MQIVGEQRVAGRGEPSRHRPAVAGRAPRSGRNPWPDRGLRPAGAGRRRRRSRLPRVPQVPDLGPRQRRIGGRRPGKRGVPFRRGRVQETVEGRWQPVVHQRQRRFAARVEVLELREHAQQHQHRVLGLPPARLRPQQEVLEGWAGERPEAGVDPLGVGDEQVTQVGRAGGQHAAGAVAQEMAADLAVGAQRRRPHQLGQLAGGAAAQQVHLEEAVLRVDEAGGEGDVAAAGAADRRHSGGVALDQHRRRQPLHHQPSGGRRQGGQQAMAQPQAAADAEHHQDGGERAQGTGQPAPEPPPRRGPARCPLAARRTRACLPHVAHHHLSPRRRFVALQSQRCRTTVLYGGADRGWRRDIRAWPPGRGALSPRPGCAALFVTMRPAG